MEYPKIIWKEDKLEECLKALEDYAIDFGTRNKEYYRNNSAYKRSLAKGLRILAILASAVAGVLPVLSQISANNNKYPIDPAWATVAVTVAITAIGLDRFFGFSSGWVRFITTEIKIESKIEQLRLSIENERFSWQGQPPTFDKAKATLGIIISFLNEISEIVKDETNTWVIEFQNVLQKLNEDLKVEAETTKLGGIKVTVENGEKCNEGLIIHLEGQQPVTFQGSSYSFNNLFPKIYRLSVSGSYYEDIGGSKQKKQLHDETLVNVTPNAIVDATIKLK